MKKKNPLVKKGLEEIVENFREGYRCGHFEKLIYLSPLMFGISTYYAYTKNLNFYTGLFGITSIGTGLMAIVHTYYMGKIKREKRESV